MITIIEGPGGGERPLQQRSGHLIRARLVDGLSHVVRVDRTYACSWAHLNTHAHTCQQITYDVHFLQNALFRNPQQLGISNDSPILHCIHLIQAGLSNISQLSNICNHCHDKIRVQLLLYIIFHQSPLAVDFKSMFFYDFS